MRVETGRVCTIWRVAEEITLGWGRVNGGGSGKQAVIKARIGVGLGKSLLPQRHCCSPGAGGRVPKSTLAHTCDPRTAEAEAGGF